MNGLVVEVHDLLGAVPCDVNVTCSDEGEVAIAFKSDDQRIDMNFDEFREIIEFVAVHGLGMHQPALVESSETKDGAWAR